MWRSTTCFPWAENLPGLRVPVGGMVCERSYCLEEVISDVSWMNSGPPLVYLESRPLKEVLASKGVRIDSPGPGSAAQGTFCTPGVEGDDEPFGLLLWWFVHLPPLFSLAIDVIGRGALWVA